MLSDNNTRSELRIHNLGKQDIILPQLLSKKVQLQSLFPICIGISSDGQTVLWETELHQLEPFRSITCENAPIFSIYQCLIEQNYSLYNDELEPVILSESCLPQCLLAISQNRNFRLLISRRQVDRYQLFSICNIAPVYNLFATLTLQAETDRLTGLLNRNAILSKGHNILRSDKYALVAYIDLDNLKRHNDNWGHALGDNYIVALCNYLEDFYEDIADKNKAFARLAGDEFVICLGGFADAAGRDAAVAGLNESCPFLLPNGEYVTIAFSTGVARYPEDADDMEDLVVYADFAMSMTKGFDKGGISFFSKSDHENFLDFSKNEQQLEKIIREQAISFIYIPYIDVKSGNVAVFEMFPVSSVRGLEDIDKIKVAAKHCHRLLEIDNTIFEAMKLEFRELARIGFPQVVTLGYMPQDLFYQNELEDMFDLSEYPSQRLCLCFDSEMRSHYDRMRNIDKVKQLNCRFGFKNFTRNTTSDAIAFNPHIVKLNLELSRACSSDELKAETVKQLISTAKETGFATAANIADKRDIAFFQDLNIDLLGGEAIYGSIVSAQISEHSQKPSFWTAL